MIISKKALAGLTSAFLAATALVVVTSATAAPGAPVECDGTRVSLVVSTGSNQYFECNDSDGAIRQSFSSRNPWVVDPSSPALLETPTAAPGSAVGQIFIGASQGVGVISSRDNTGSERDSISREETLTLRKDGLTRNFSGIQLGVNVLQRTAIRVEALSADGTVLDTETTPSLAAGRRNVAFFSGAEAVNAVGFRIGTATNAGAFSLDGSRQTELYLVQPDLTPPGLVSGVDAAEDVTSIALSWTNPSDEDLDSVIVRRSTTGTPGDAGAGVGVPVTGTQPATQALDEGLLANTRYYYAIFTRDAAGNTSAGVAFDTTTLAAGVEDLTADPALTSVLLTWTNPTPAPTGVVVRRLDGPPSATTPPTVDDGVPVTVDPGLTSAVDSDLDPATTYYYAVFAQFDAVTSGPATVDVTTQPGIIPGGTDTVVLNDGQLTSTVEFVQTDSCNASAVPIEAHDVALVNDVGLPLYSLSAEWIVPDKTDPIPNSDLDYGNCLFRWTTEAVGVEYSLTPLMDYDGADGPKPAEAIPGCEFAGQEPQAPPTEYGTPNPGDRPFCLISDSYDGPTQTKTTTVLVWNDPRRFI